MTVKRTWKLKAKLAKKKLEKKVVRCHWVSDDPLYIKYHDEEWGVPVRDDKTIFEFLTLESAQAGLSWITILKKRENYRKAFSNFDVKKVSQYTEKDVKRLLKNDGIIRNQLKIRATITNAQKFLEVQKEFGTFSEYIWSFVSHKTIKNMWKSKKFHATTKESDELSLDLKRRGFKFVGSTIVYAHMQATGMVNDHIRRCFRYNQV